MGFVVLLGTLLTMAATTAATIESTTVRSILYWCFLPLIIIGLITLWWVR